MGTTWGRAKRDDQKLIRTWPDSKWADRLILPVCTASFLPSVFLRTALHVIRLYTQWAYEFPNITLFFSSVSHLWTVRMHVFRNCSKKRKVCSRKKTIQSFAQCASATTLNIWIITSFLTSKDAMVHITHIKYDWKNSGMYAIGWNGSPLSNKRKRTCWATSCYTTISRTEKGEQLAD